MLGSNERSRVVIDLALESFRRFNVSVAGSMVFSGDAIAELGIMDRHYGYINRLSRIALISHSGASPTPESFPNPQLHVQRAPRDPATDLSQNLAIVESRVGSRGVQGRPQKTFSREPVRLRESHPSTGRRRPAKHFERSIRYPRSVFVPDHHCP